MLTIVIVMRMGTRVSGECRLVGMRELMVVVEEKGVCRVVGALPHWGKSILRVRSPVCNAMRQ